MVVSVVSLVLVGWLVSGLAVDSVIPLVGADGESVGLPVVKLLFSVTVLLTVVVLDSVLGWEKVISALVVNGFIVDSVVAFSVVVVATETVECSVVDGGEAVKLLVVWLLLEFELAVTVI